MTVPNVIERNIPIRFGLVPIAETEESKFLFRYLSVDVTLLGIPKAHAWQDYFITSYKTMVDPKPWVSSRVSVNNHLFHAIMTCFSL